MKAYFKKDKFDYSSNEDLRHYKSKLYNNNVIKNRQYNNQYYQKMRRELCHHF